MANQNLNSQKSKQEEEVEAPGSTAAANETVVSSEQGGIWTLRGQQRTAATAFLRTKDAFTIFPIGFDKSFGKIQRRIAAPLGKVTCVISCLSYQQGTLHCCRLPWLAVKITLICFELDRKKVRKIKIFPGFFFFEWASSWQACSLGSLMWIKIQQFHLVCQVQIWIWSMSEIHHHDWVNLWV